MPSVVLQSNAPQQRFITMTTDANHHPSRSDGHVSEELKKDLKQRIKLKYHKLGRDIHPDYKPDVQYQLTSEELEKRDRRRKQNREAATRCRIKKKGEESQVFKDYAAQRALNAEYTSEIERLTLEVIKLQEQLDNHPCCMRRSTEVTQDAHSKYRCHTGASPNLLPEQTNRRTQGTLSVRKGSFPVFHPSSSLTPDDDDVDMNGVEGADVEHCGWASSVSESMQMEGGPEEMHPSFIARSESIGFSVTSRHDTPPAEPRDVDDGDLFSSGNQVPTTKPSMPTSDLECRQAGTIPQQSQRQRTILVETPSAPLLRNIPTTVALAEEDEYSDLAEESNVPRLIPIGSHPTLPPLSSIDLNSLNLPDVPPIPSMDLPSLSDLQAPFDLASFKSMEGIMSQIPLAVGAGAIPGSLTSATTSFPLLPAVISSSGKATASRAATVPSQLSGLSASPPAVTTTAESLSNLSWENNDGQATKFQTDNSVWIQMNSPEVLLGETQTHPMPEMPCPSGSYKLHVDMLMNSDASRAESRSPSTAPNTPRASHPNWGNEQGRDRTSGSSRGYLDQNGMLTHGFSPNGHQTYAFVSRAGNQASGGNSLEASLATLGGDVSLYGIGSMERHPSASPVPTLPPESAVSIQRALNAGQLEATTDEEQETVLNDLPIEVKEAIYTWHRHGAQSGSFNRSSTGFSFSSTH